MRRPACVTLPPSTSTGIRREPPTLRFRGLLDEAAAGGAKNQQLGGQCARAGQVAPAGRRGRLLGCYRWMWTRGRDGRWSSVATAPCSSGRAAGCGLKQEATTQSIGSSRWPHLRPAAVSRRAQRRFLVPDRGSVRTANVGAALDRRLAAIEPRIAELHRSEDRLRAVILASPRAIGRREQRHGGR